ncbi:unnamed protein product [Litomosoides sigmodontis]|uniref:Uncharacterized protein n=1 Tax=Litomosoides sigmodontis TaxID=42156 RepID=A0A3P6UP76_LITSI|nr:unnamed protein product [Litomosoides sigmodontis]
MGREFLMRRHSLDRGIGEKRNWLVGGDKRGRSEMTDKVLRCFAYAAPTFKIHSSASLASKGLTGIKHRASNIKRIKRQQTHQTFPFQHTPLKISEMSKTDSNKPKSQRFARFNATLCTLLTSGLFCFASNLLYTYDEATGSLMALTAYIFTYNWYMLYGNALTRARRAFLNVANVLNTYQVYNRKYGQFYESDPDTPGDAADTFKKAAAVSVGDILKETQAASTSDDRTKFEEAVQKHYADVYQAVQRAEREMRINSPTEDEIDIQHRTDKLEEVRTIPPLPPNSYNSTANEKLDKSNATD